MNINRNMINVLNLIINSVKKHGYYIYNIYTETELEGSYTMLVGNVTNKTNSNIEHFEVAIDNCNMSDNIDPIYINIFGQQICISSNDVDGDEYVQNRYLIADKINVIANKIEELYHLIAISIDYSNSDDMIVAEFSYHPKDQDNMCISSYMNLDSEYSDNISDSMEVTCKDALAKYAASYENTDNIIWLDIEPDLSNIEGYEQVYGRNQIVIPGEVKNNPFGYLSATFGDHYGAYVMFDPDIYSSEFIINNYPIDIKNFKIIKVN